MPKYKHICMISVHGYFDPVPTLGTTDTGGQVTYVLELAKALATAGIGVDIYTRRFGGRAEIEAVNNDVRVIRIQAGGNDFIRKEDLFPCLDEFIDNMATFIKSHDVDYGLYHSHYWDAGYVGINVGERFGKPHVYTAHSLGAWKQEQMGGDPATMEALFNFKQRIHWEHVIFDKSTAQTVTTVGGLETYKRLYGFESARMVVIPPGVDTTRFRPLRHGETDSDLGTPDKYIFALSRIDSNKGLDFLIRALALAKDNTDAHLVIGGGSQHPNPHEVDVKRSLTALVDADGISDRVHFAGHVPDEALAPYYRRAKLFVLPSKYEPFGMTVLEAMACGTPVVATVRGGLRHVLHDGVDSVLADPSVPEELSAAISMVLTDAELARNLARAGLALITDKFSWPSIARQHVSFYDSCA